MSNKKEITPCQDFLATCIKVTYEEGGNGNDLYLTLNELAIHLDENMIKDNQTRSVGENHQIYSQSTISDFKSLCFRMRRNQINYNKK